MASISNIIFYVLIFISVYVQVFFFVTFLENRKKIVVRNGKTKLGFYPGVTIAVPCFNEEKTVYQTVRSLLDMNYPKDKLNLILIDDGSTDNTWEIISKFSKYSNIKIFRKENGGKHTALNLALKETKTDFFGGLDADSIVDPEALARIISCFENDPSIMAVAPSVTVYNPKNFIQNAQKIEYYMGIYFKRMLGFLGAINVTPGPLTIFRKRVFDDLGPYRKAHNTEDMEIAYRMQKNRYKIEHCNDAHVYTSTPSSVKKLYKQRLRWIYGFINNTIDYKGVIFRKKYGNFSFFTLPMGIISIISVSYLFGRIFYSLGYFLYSRITQFQTSGWNFNLQFSNFDFFFIKIQLVIFLIIILYTLVVFAIIFGRKMAEDKWGFSIHMIYFFPVFAVIAPFCFIRAVFSTLLNRVPAWR